MRDTVWRSLTDCDTRSRVLMIYNRTVTENRLRNRFIRHLPNGTASLDADTVEKPRVMRLSAIPPQ